MIFADPTRVEMVNKELREILAQFDVKKNDAEITTSSGRTYNVANVIEDGEDWIVTDLFARSLCTCKPCNKSMGDAWTQFRSGDKVVRMHESLIHYFLTHPAKVPQSDKVDLVFLG